MCSLCVHCGCTVTDPLLLCIFISCARTSTESGTILLKGLSANIFATQSLTGNTAHSMSLWVSQNRLPLTDGEYKPNIRYQRNNYTLPGTQIPEYNWARAYVSKKERDAKTVQNLTPVCPETLIFKINFIRKPSLIPTHLAAEPRPCMRTHNQFTKQWTVNVRETFGIPMCPRRAYNFLAQPFHRTTWRRIRRARSAHTVNTQCTHSEHTVNTQLTLVKMGAGAIIKQ